MAARGWQGRRARPAAPVLAGAVAAFALDERARDAADQARGPFLLVAGLLMLGLVADHDGVFRWASARLLGVTTHPRRLLAVALALVAVVTALLNLDTAVVFLTPVLIGAARGAGTEVEPFLYGSVLMANASSLLLPGANLTNLLVLASEPVSGATFVARVLPAALAAAAVTALGLMAKAGATTAVRCAGRRRSGARRHRRAAPPRARRRRLRGRRRARPRPARPEPAGARRGDRGGGWRAAPSGAGRSSRRSGRSRCWGCSAWRSCSACSPARGRARPTCWPPPRRPRRPRSARWPR